MSKWHPNTGKSEHPRDPSARLDIRLRCGREVHDVLAGHYRWSLTDAPGDILFGRRSEGPACGWVPDWCDNPYKTGGKNGSF